ncbi:hypothetical protein [Paraflavitalea pollutisoli]|uniref:hypothetical protein n=1 Tax=Paraflavitalea pollutisoli TaxID=3034143 RepID=UPI0023EC2C4F|nr:hypothetical protein [Paraflavitalea sp. H1-2-19X]
MIKLIPSILVLLLLAACKETARPVLAPEYLHPEKDMHLITSLINNSDSTIALLYGNEPAIQYGKAIEKVHRSDEKYVLVTAHLRQMPHWYGTNMNGPIVSIEQVAAHLHEAGNISYAYSKHNREGEVLPDTVGQAARIRFIIDQPLAVAP